MVNDVGTHDFKIYFYRLHIEYIHLDKVCIFNVNKTMEILSLPNTLAYIQNGLISIINFDIVQSVLQIRKRGSFV